MQWLLGALALVFLLDGLRARARLGQIAKLAPSDEPVAPEHVFVTAPGLELDEATRRAASAHARAHGLELLDLIPGDAHAAMCVALTQLVDPSKYRSEPFAPGRTAGYAMLATTDLVERAGRREPPGDAIELWELAATLKRYAVADFAFAPGLRARPRDPNTRRGIVEHVVGEFYIWTMLIPFLLAALLGYGAIAHPVAAGAALASYHVAIAIACLGIVRSRDLGATIALRLPLDLARSVRLLLDRHDPERARVETLRPVYAALLSDGWERFFEPPVTACVHCNSSRLKTLWSTGDQFQQKPGRFTLVRCRDCRVVFQNPRLSTEGLAFYYRDYYDGLGAELTERVFASYGPVYANRAKMVGSVTTPRRWLDVGCGHGHFCRAARELLPDVELDGLDWSSSVVDAHRRRWIGRAHRGSLPQLAPSLRAQYDVVSMFHYLEHVLDPAAEIAAARSVLEPGGFLVIEVPEPDSVVGRALGRWWVNWLQPQHLRFLSIRHLDELLRAQGFTPMKWDRAKAHMPIDFSWAMILLLQRLGPLTDRPWNPPSTTLQRLRRRTVWTLGAPLVFAAGLIDRLVSVFAEPLHSWNLYRVTARLDSGTVGDTA